MSKHTTRTEYGYRTLDGVVHKVDDAGANEAYMSPIEYAQLRAKHTGGEVVVRSVTTTTSDWSGL